MFIPGKTEDASPIDFLQPKSFVTCAIQCGGLWFTNGKYSVTWKLSQALVKSSNNLNTGECVLKLNDSQREHLDKVTATATTEGDASSDSTNLVVQDPDDDGTAVTEPVVEEQQKKGRGGTKKK